MLNEDMTRDMGANRTFRSIFGDEERAVKEQQAADGVEEAAALDAGGEGAGEKQEERLEAEQKEEEEEEDGMWSDEAAPANGDELLGDELLGDNNEDADETGAAASDNGVSSNKSMADWADDDDDEEVWKDALQARVNQLELVFQTRGPAPLSLVIGEDGEEEGFHEPSQGFTNVLRLANEDGGAHGNRHKLQRTAKGRAAWASSSSSLSSSTCGTGRLTTVPPPSPQNGLRKKRTTSKDFIARNIQAVELKRSISGGSSSSRTDSPSSAAVTARLRGKGSAKMAVTSPTTSSTLNNGRGSRGARSAASVSTARDNGAVFNLSETEAIRRFVVNDIKQMSMERLVNNAKRLHFLEKFYKHHAPATTATSSTAAAAPLSPSSSRSDTGTT